MDHLFAHFELGEYETADYTPEEVAYARKQIQRIASTLNVKNHTDLTTSTP